MRHLTLFALVSVTITVNSLSIIFDEGRPVYDPILPLLQGIPECEEGWKMGLGVCYRLLEGPFTWEEANEACDDVGGILASIHSSQQNDFAFVPGVWIGLQEVNGTYVWSDGGPTNYLNFGPEQPWTGHCVGYGESSDWLIFPCEQRRPAVCQKGCPFGWTLDTVTGSCYFLLEDELTWEDANNQCFEFGSNLASIHSQQENDFINSWVEFNTWIGLNDLETENKFEWSDGTPVDYLNWSPGEPSVSHSDENCVYMDKARYPEQGSWNDYYCIETYNALCKRVGQSPAVDCVVSDWACWSGCSRTCGSGTKSRTRVIMQKPRNGGKPCGALVDYQFCNRQECPVDCVMSVWTMWTDCSKTCGGGTQSRTRHVEIQPSNGGEPCLPDVYEEQFCNREKCPGCPPPVQVVICEDDPSESISCPLGTTIYVTYANYGRLADIPQCPNFGIPNNNCGEVTSTEIVQNMCTGLRECVLTASNDIFGNPCPGTDKYLEVEYLCL